MMVWPPLTEGFSFVNVTFDLLQGGAKYCTSPHLSATLAAQVATLEAAMAFHSSSHLFDDLIDDSLSLLCSEPEAYDGEYERIYDAVAEQIDADVFADEQDCTLDAAEVAQLPYLTSNPPDAHDLITIFEGDTNVMVQAASEFVSAVLAAEGCVDVDANQSNWSAAAQIAAELRASTPRTGFSADGCWRALLRSRAALACSPAPSVLRARTRQRRLPSALCTSPPPHCVLLSPPFT
jgi:hypothetical protein